MSDDIKTDSISFALIVINLTVWILGLLQPKIPILSILPVSVESGGIYYPVIAAGQWYRIITAMFIHDGPVHLLSNMLGVFAIGSMMERVLGKKRFLIVYMAGGIGGNLLVLFLDHMTGICHYTIGASGAVMGLLGSVLIYALINRDRAGKAFLKRVVFACILMLIPATPNVSVAAHVGGFISGAAMAWLLHHSDNLRDSL